MPTTVVMRELSRNGRAPAVGCKESALERAIFSARGAVNFKYAFGELTK